MHLRSTFMLFRGRLIMVSVFTMILVLFVVFNAIGESPTDIGVFWHHICDCPPDTRDVLVFFDSLAVICGYMGIFLGIVTGITLSVNTGATGRNTGPIALGDTLFFLTRPIPRGNILFPPLLIATAALTIIPASCFLLILGWLRLVHAPALAHIAADMQLVPSIAALGPHPTFFQTIAAAPVYRHYLAAISVGLCAYALMSAQRWLSLSPNKNLRQLILVPFLLLIFGPLFILWTIFGDHPAIFSTLLLWAPKGASLDYQPSILAIALHFAFAAAVLYGSWRLVQQADL